MTRREGLCNSISFVKIQFNCICAYNLVSKKVVVSLIAGSNSIHFDRRFASRCYNFLHVRLSEKSRMQNMLILLYYSSIIDIYLISLCHSFIVQLPIAEYEMRQWPWDAGESNSHVHLCFLVSVCVFSFKFMVRRI